MPAWRYLGCISTEAIFPRSLSPSVHSGLVWTVSLRGGDVWEQYCCFVEAINHLTWVHFLYTPSSQRNLPLSVYPLISEKNLTYWALKRAVCLDGKKNLKPKNKQIKISNKFDIHMWMLRSVWLFQALFPSTSFCQAF